jgi:formylglycine-generating enzyme
MKNTLRHMRIFMLVLISTALLSSCSLIQKKNGQSTITGLEFGSDDADTLFVPRDVSALLSPTGMVFIQGGRTVLGSFEEDLMGSRDNIERTVTVNSFYMDETEITNLNWKEYVHFVKKDSTQQFYETTLPNDEVWFSEFSFNDVYAENYYSNPAFNNFPVVGISWEQVADFSTWRTEFVNDLIRDDVGLGDTLTKKELIERGVSMPEFRLPNEAEWEYAAKATVGTQYLDENEEYGRVYPWDGRGVRNPYGKGRGEMLANFKRGRGDYAGIAGTVNNDGDIIIAEVATYPPNDFGLYNMAANVSEWVYDIYRPLSYQDFDDLNPVRKNSSGDSQDIYGYKWKDDDVKKEIQVTDAKESYRSLVNDRLRVYKGGSWKDLAYWMSPGTRRFLTQDDAGNSIGFRCAMISIGAGELDNGKGFFGNLFGGKK